MWIRLTLVLMIMSGSACAQQYKTSSVGLNTTGYWIDETFRVIAVPQLTFMKRKHSVGVGPAIMVATEIAASNKNFPKLVGLQVDYTYYPNGVANKFNLFLFNELNLQRIKDTWTSVSWTSSSQSYNSYKYKSIEYIAQDLIGYGIEASLIGRLQIKTKVGIGVYYSVQDGDEITEGAPEIEDGIGNGYKPFGFSYGISVGLIFKL